MRDVPLPIHKDPEVLGGTLVFMGTRVPVDTLLDYFEGGDSLDNFLRDFPSVKREQAVAVLQFLREELARQAPAA